MGGVGGWGMGVEEGLEGITTSKQTLKSLTRLTRTHAAKISSFYVSVCRSFPPLTATSASTRGKNSPLRINLSLSLTITLPEYPSTSHPVSPPIPNRRGDKE